MIGKVFNADGRVAGIVAPAGEELTERFPEEISFQVLRTRDGTDQYPAWSNWIPGDLVAPLCWLGKHDWLTFTIEPEPRKTTVARQLPPSLLRAPNGLALLDEIAGSSVLNLIRLYCASKALAQGPKLLRPSYRDCVAFENKDLAVAFDDYQQPYPTVLVEFPESYRQELTERFGVNCCRGIICHHEKPAGHIVCITDAISKRPQIIDIMTARPEYHSIEQALNVRSDEGKDIEQGIVLQRVALNLCRMLTIAGCRVVGPADRKQLATIKKGLRRSNRGTNSRLRLAKQAIPTVITFDQSIEYDLFEAKVSKPRGESESTEAKGVSKTPHWRRGHFRRQRFGPGRSQVRLQFIRPVLVNKPLFQGEQADSAVTYKSKGAAEPEQGCSGPTHCK